MSLTADIQKLWVFRPMRKDDELKFQPIAFPVKCYPNLKKHMDEFLFIVMHEWKIDSVAELPPYRVAQELLD